jgi:PEP-CTERM motif
MVRRLAKLPIVLGLALLLLFVPSRSHATFVDYESGSLKSGAGGGIFVTGGGWGEGAFQLSWDIDFDSATGQYRYIYTISNPLDITPPVGQLAKDLSHWLLQVSTTFTSNDLLAGSTTPDEGPTTYNAHPQETGSNPGLPSDIYGFKYDDLTVTVITLREPIDGSFYAKDGNSCNPFGCPGHSAVFGYNTGLTDPSGAFIRVPDTRTTLPPTEVPEPTALFLLGVGLIVVGASARRLTGKD